MQSVKYVDKCYNRRVSERQEIEMSRYLVTFCGRRSEIIKAHDDEEAIQIAQAMAFDAGIDVDVDCVQRLKPIKRYNTYNPDDAPRYEYV